MDHAFSTPSEARRLTDFLRAGSEQTQRFTSKGPLDERKATLQLVLEGGVLRQRFLADGRRHTIAVYYRDDVINLMGYIGSGRGNTDYLLVLKGSVIGSVPDAAVHAMRSLAAPGLDGVGALVYRELGIAQERMISLGQRTAIEAMAHFFCETLMRCAQPGANFKTRRCDLHMTQDMLSSVLGISTVHVSRTLQELRHRRLADVVDNELVVYDFDALAALGEFDDGYLAPV
ncbi:MAG: Crp/Fnr family transcriptional regulator [Devosia sp.]